MLRCRRRRRRRVHDDDHPRRGRQPVDGGLEEARPRFRELALRYPRQYRDAARGPAPAAGDPGRGGEQRTLRPVHDRHLRSSAVGEEGVDRESQSVHRQGFVLRAGRPHPRYQGCPQLQQQSLRGALLRRVINAHVPQGHAAGCRRDDARSPDVGPGRGGGAEGQQLERQRNLPPRPARLGRAARSAGHRGQHIWRALVCNGSQRSPSM